jgi:hypothetical protein
MDYTLVSQVYLFGVTFYLLRTLSRNLHPQLNLTLLPLLLQDNTMIVLGVFLDRDGRRIKFLSPQLLNLLDLLLEALILILRKHILKFIIKLLLPILNINLKRVPIESIGIRIS